MITKTTRSNSQAYRDLFQIATDWIKTKPDYFFKDEEQEYQEFKEKGGILNLDEYFLFLKDLITSCYTSGLKKEESDSMAARFISLPVDEDFFEIDANTRTIKIPEIFKNGVSVMGDQAAETIYFKIDRYFDHIDLATMNILVEYQDSEGEWHYTKVDIINNNVAGKIIFGWPISLQATQYSGNIKLAVRFYGQNDDKELVYSFRTTPIVVKIKESIGYNFDFESFLDGEGTPDTFSLSSIVNRIKESKWYDIDTTVSPEFIVPIEYKDDEVPVIFIGQKDNIIPVDEEGLLYEESEEAEDTDVSFYIVSAYAYLQDMTNGNAFTYKWTREIPPGITYEGGNSEAGITDILNAEDGVLSTFYLKTKDVKPDNRKIYFYKDGSDLKSIDYNTIQEELKENANFFEDKKEEGLYEQRCGLKINKFGDYNITIKGAGRLNQPETRKVCIVPSPRTKNLQFKTLDTGKEQTKVFDNETEDQILELGEPVIIIGKYAEQEEKYSKKEYQWYYRQNKESEWKKVQDILSEELENDGVDNEKLYISRHGNRGYYQLEAKQNLNGAFAIKKSDEIYVDYGPLPCPAASFEVYKSDGTLVEEDEKGFIISYPYDSEEPQKNLQKIDGTQNEEIGLVKYKPYENYGNEADGKDLSYTELGNNFLIQVRIDTTERERVSNVHPFWEVWNPIDKIWTTTPFIDDGTEIRVPSPTGRSFFNYEVSFNKNGGQKIGYRYRLVIESEYKGQLTKNYVAYISLQG